MGMKYLEERETENRIGPGHYYLYNWLKPYVKKKKILDIGCWTGTLEILFERDDCHITGIDIEEEPLVYSSKRFPQYTFARASIIDPLPFKKQEFDIILYFMVIEHLPKHTEKQAFVEINKVLKPGGMLFMNTMHSNLLSNLFDPAYWLTGHRHYSKQHLTKLLEETGFRLEEVHYNGGFFTVIHMFILYFYKHILHKPEPHSRLLEKFIALDYRNKGFSEIAIKAIKL